MIIDFTLKYIETKPNQEEWCKVINQVRLYSKLYLLIELVGSQGNKEIKTFQTNRTSIVQQKFQFPKVEK